MAHTAAAAQPAYAAWVAARRSSMDTAYAVLLLTMGCFHVVRILDFNVCGQPAAAIAVQTSAQASPFGQLGEAAVAALAGIAAEGYPCGAGATSMAKALFVLRRHPWGSIPRMLLVRATAAAAVRTGPACSARPCPALPQGAARLTSERAHAAPHAHRPCLRRSGTRLQFRAWRPPGW